MQINLQCIFNLNHPINSHLIWTCNEFLLHNSSYYLFPIYMEYLVDFFVHSDFSLTLLFTDNFPLNHKKLYCIYMLANTVLIYAYCENLEEWSWNRRGSGVSLTNWSYNQHKLSYTILFSSPALNLTTKWGIFLVRSTGSSYILQCCSKLYTKVCIELLNWNNRRGKSNIVHWFL